MTIIAFWLSATREPPGSKASNCLKLIKDLLEFASQMTVRRPRLFVRDRLNMLEFASSRVNKQQMYLRPHTM